MLYAIPEILLKVALNTNAFPNSRSYIGPSLIPNQPIWTRLKVSFFIWYAKTIFLLFFPKINRNIFSIKQIADFVFILVQGWGGDSMKYDIWRWKSRSWHGTGTNVFNWFLRPQPIQQQYIYIYMHIFIQTTSYHTFTQRNPARKNQIQLLNYTLYEWIF